MNIFFSSAVIGNIGTPPQFDNGGFESGVTGLMAFVSTIVKFIIVLGGLWAFINLIMAGFSYITSGDKPDELAKAHQKIYMSVIGLVVLVSSFVLAGIMGYLLYGDATAILNPKIYGPGN